MARSRRVAAFSAVAGLLLCPLASTGAFAACHEGEAAMDCCLPYDGGAVPSSPAPVVTAPLSGAAPTVLIAAALADAAAPDLHGEARAALPGGARRHALLSVFLI